MKEKINDEKREKMKMRERTVLQARDLLSKADKTVLKRKKISFKAAVSASKRVLFLAYVSQYFYNTFFVSVLFRIVMRNVYSLLRTKLS